jgi:hypothetical protein
MEAVGSREYKLMLQASEFEGDDEKLLASARALWGDLAATILPHVLSVRGGTEVEHKRRQVRFLDTAQKWLRSNNYVVRERLDLEDHERTVTLKFRHPDRYISQGREMAPADGFEKDMKFEEDIKPEFLKLYSFSSSAIIPEGTKLATLADVAAIFPGLPRAVDAFPEGEKLEVVGGFTAHERVVKGASFQIRKNPETFAECSLTLWYPGKADDKPIIAEFSFKYEDPGEGYTAKLSQRAYDAFMAIQSQPGDWVDAKSMTKTAYVYALGDAD